MNKKKLNNVTDKKNILKFIFTYFKKYKKRLFLILLSVIFITIISVITPIMGKKLFDLGIIQMNMKNVLTYILVITILFLLEQVISFLQFTQYEYINKDIGYRLLEEAFGHSINLKVSYYKDNNFSKVINNTYSDINHISRVMNASIIQSIVSLFKIMGGIVGLALINWKLMLFIIVIIPLNLIISGVIAKHRRKTFKLLIKSNEKFAIWFNETLNGIEIVKMWNLRRRKLSEFSELQREVVKNGTKIDYIDEIGQRVMQFVNHSFNYGLIILGAIFISNNELTIGGLYAFIAYSEYVIRPIEIISALVGKISSSIPSFKRYLEFFNNETEDISVKDKKIIGPNDNVDNISFENVTLKYMEEQNVINNISFSIQAGEKVGFVGLNGSGKSSIINLLLRFYETNRGSIKLNDIDIRELNLEGYRELFAVMNQQVFLFNNSIKYNIDINNELDKNKLNKYLRMSQLDDLISNLPEGIDTSVGYNGTKLSGGEKQKIALARTLSKDGKILILDEATASFDFKSEHTFNKFISNTNLYDIIIVITHRLEILKTLDKIFILEGGKLLDCGSFKELELKGIDIETKLLNSKGGYLNDNIKNI